MPGPRGGEQRAEPDEQYEVTRVVQRFHDGPLPLASEFADYNRGTPNAADRMLTMAEKDLDAQIELNREESRHRMAMEREESQRRNQLVSTEHAAMLEGARFGRRAQYLAALVAIVFAAVAVVAVLYDQPWVGAAFGGLAIVGVVGAFLNQPEGDGPQPAPDRELERREDDAPTNSEVERE